MNLSDIITKCYILALIIRDDGERLLLGDGIYEFKSSLQHFAPNIYQNDVIELQGTDGQLLAGQVRRSATQAFDGYIADGTIGKTDTEQSRRRFLGFFRKKHHYKVVYVMPDGTAVQRDRGYIVDAPAVQELYQLFPEYHIGLNFEDPNYYEYDENGEGEEIPANTALISLANLLTGGLVWDNLGAVSQEKTWLDWENGDTIDGFYQYTNGLAGAPLEFTHLYGNATQTGAPTPDAPIPIETVTGAQSVKITGKNLYDISATVKGRVDNGVIGYADGTSVLDATDTTVTFTTTAVWRGIVSGLMRVKPSQTYTFSATVSVETTRFIDAYDIDGNWIARMTDITGVNATFTTPANCYGLRISYQRNIAGTSTISKPMLERSSTATAFEPYQSQSQEINLGALELAKIGDYQDYIWNDDGTWKIHKAIGKVVLDGTTDDTVTGYYAYGERSNAFAARVSLSDKVSDNQTCVALSDKFHVVGNGRWNIWYTGNTREVGDMGSDSSGNGLYLGVPTANNTGELIKSYFSSNPTTVYYALATPTDTEITDSELIQQLSAILNTYQGTNNLWLIPSAGAQGELSVHYATGSIDVGAGYEWEEGSGDNSNIVENPGIDRVNPIWKVPGPATNPTLTNITTGQTISWIGSVASGETLTVDLNRQTAELGGANVFSQLSGDWLALAPGANRLEYSATGATQGCTLEWNGVLG